MSKSPAESTQDIKNVTPTQIPLEIEIEVVSEEEMALIDAALATATRCSQLSSSSAISATSCFPSSQLLQRNVRSIQSITLLAKRRLSGIDGPGEPDIEDSGHFAMTQKRNRVAKSFLERFRKNRALSVTDIKSTEWCEKQMEFMLLFGRPIANKAMKVGHARHVKLEGEVITKVKVPVQSFEDRWAIKFINFINGANQLLSEGLTRELPLFGFIEGVWMVGVIDEIQMPVKETDINPMIVDVKTRVLETLPAESQRRNGRLQLMCYKYMWDNLAAGNFPSRQFFDFFSLNPYHVLSEEVRENTAEAGYPAKTLDDIVRYYMNAWNMLPPAHNQLLLRYEFQNDQSLLGEVEFAYDHDWLKSRIQGCLEFWRGEREASYIPDEERWKCKYCRFASVCPAIGKPESSRSPSKTNSDSIQS
ncbi:hypothetical protein EZV62_002475 [Acer yangbiense]|uniref:Exonuclease V, chloroplastic n=1 Tax=Acer yangbiense TaxID=1000413 RepID=A0A5C7IZQ1_9ROSI|nr:hypothetical protein EZV62_002475 [Acer yangbiense]